MSAGATQDDSASIFGRRSGAVVVVLPSWIGDIVMATPALRAISALVGADGRSLVATVRPGAAPLLDGLPSAVDERRPLADAVVDVDARGLLGTFRAAAAVRRVGAAAAVLLPNSFRTALVVRLAGVPRRLGYATDGRGFLLSQSIRRAKPRQPVSAVDWYAELITELSGRTVEDRRPRLVVTDAERDRAESLQRGLPRPFVLLNPGANRVDKRWPADRFSQLGRLLRDKDGVGVAVTGGPSERSLVAEVAAACGGVDLATRGIDLATLKAVIADAAALVSNDTGPRHIAVGLDTPVVTLFGPTDHRWTAISGVRERRVLAEPFLPSELVADRHAKWCAIDRIPVGDVHAAVASLLDGTADRVAVSSSA